LIAVSALLQACTQERPHARLAEDPVLVLRRERDAAFKSNPQSPIPEKDRGRFQGLSYYPLNPALRFQIILNRYTVPESVRMATNTGEIREGLRYGYFEFRAEGQICKLQVYRMDDDANPGKPYLFIPFRDSTAGRETYTAGRYIDLPENTSGVYDLDFNRAYNPHCAYGEEFSCPIPPDENRLSIPIRAGEKLYLPVHNP
jgi:uncharacterized protein (DUF1684 family)